jgi:hypothetical protein
MGLKEKRMSEFRLAAYMVLTMARRSRARAHHRAGVSH